MQQDQQTTQDKGHHGENLAIAWLQQNGYVILARNWRAGHHELDIVASHQSILCFVEVKTRTYQYYGAPEDFLTPAQQKRIWQAACVYMRKNNYDGEVRFDIVSVYSPGGQLPVIRHLKDVFFPGWNS